MAHYFDIYERHFNRFKQQQVSLLEIGVFQGGSLNMWRDYFGKDAKIYAIDINPECKQFEGPNTKIFIGSQEDPDFLGYVKSQIPKLDIVIDDGGHTMKQQIVSFENLYNYVDENGIYIVEDLHTSYWRAFEGGLGVKGTFIEYSKGFIDQLHQWHYNQSTISEFTKSTFGLHFYDSVLVIEKKPIAPPVSKITGKIVAEIVQPPLPIFQ